MRRAFAAMIAAAFLSAGLPAPVHAAAPWDIRDHWARKQIEAGVADGYITGFPDGSFKPDQPITRAEFFKLLAGALRLKPQPSMDAPFAEREHWAMQQGQIQAAVSGGLLLPADYGNWLAPDHVIPRREIVLAAVRAVGKESQVGAHALTAPDAAQYEGWLQSWAAVAVKDGLLTGYEDGRLGLERSATRAEALVIVQRILSQVTMQLERSEVEAAPNTARHPGAGEPTWTVEADGDQRPRFADGTFTYPLDVQVKGFALVPAPGRAAWLILVTGPADGEDVYLLWRLQGGATQEIARYDEPAISLAVDAGGRLWFSEGTDLLVADEEGQVASISVGERLLLGEADREGNLWAIGQGPLYKVTSAGMVSRIATGLESTAQVRHLAAAEDGSVWLLLTNGKSGARVEAARIRNGALTQRVQVLGRAFGGEGEPIQAAVLGRAGEVRWVVALTSGDTQESLLRFDLETGVAQRLAAPRWTGTDPHVVPAPDGGVLLQDSGGRFWRILP